MASLNSWLPQFRASPLPSRTPIVFIVEGDICLRASMESLIRGAGWHPETCGSVHEFLAHQRPLVPSCLILALSPLSASDIELQKQIARQRPESPIIVISGNGDIPTTVRAMKAGAVDLLVKPISNAILLNAMQQAIECSRAALERELEFVRLWNGYASLSVRERQVMELVVSGLLNKQIGGRLGISEITVKKHRGCAMRKMAANSLADLVRMACKLESAPEHGCH